MNRRVDLFVDDVPATLRRTADFLGANRTLLQRLTVTGGQPARITAEFRKHAAAASVRGFTLAVGGGSRAPASQGPVEPPAPYHWQADGASDDRGE
jgi:hypothetical protein